MSQCTNLTDFAPTTFLVGIRMSAMCGTLPWLVELGISLRARFCFAAILTLLVAPPVVSTMRADVWSNPAAVIVGETVIGMAWGLGVGTFLSSIRVAAEMADAGSFHLWRSLMSSGEEGTSSTENHLFLWIALLSFLAVRGDRQVLDAFLESYERLPIGCEFPAADVIDGMVELLQQSLVVGWRVALPLGMAGMLGLLFVAFLGRMSGSGQSTTAPAPLVQVAAIALLCVALGPLSNLYGNELKDLPEQTRRL